MNWTGGRLQRHCKKNSNKTLKAQKEHFAKVRLQSQRGSTAHDSVNLLSSATSVSKPAGKNGGDSYENLQKSDEDAEVTTSTGQKQGRLRNRIFEPTETFPRPDRISLSYSTDLFRVLKFRDDLSPIQANNSFENTKRNLLSRTDWLGVAAAKPLCINFGPPKEMQRIGRHRKPPYKTILQDQDTEDQARPLRRHTLLRVSQRHTGREQIAEDHSITNGSNMHGTSSTSHSRSLPSSTPARSHDENSAMSLSLEGLEDEIDVDNGLPFARHPQHEDREGRKRSQKLQPEPTSSSVARKPSSFHEPRQEPLRSSSQDLLERHLIDNTAKQGVRKQSHSSMHFSNSILTSGASAGTSSGVSSKQASSEIIPTDRQSPKFSVTMEESNHHMSRQDQLKYVSEPIHKSVVLDRKQTPHTSLLQQHVNTEDVMSNAQNGTHQRAFHLASSEQNNKPVSSQIYSTIEATSLPDLLGIFTPPGPKNIHRLGQRCLRSLSNQQQVPLAQVSMNFTPQLQAHSSSPPSIGYQPSLAEEHVYVQTNGHKINYAPEDGHKDWLKLAFANDYYTVQRDFEFSKTPANLINTTRSLPNPARKGRNYILNPRSGTIGTCGSRAGNTVVSTPVKNVQTSATTTTFRRKQSLDPFQDSPLSETRFLLQLSPIREVTRERLVNISTYGKGATSEDSFTASQPMTSRFEAQHQSGTQNSIALMHKQPEVKVLQSISGQNAPRDLPLSCHRRPLAPYQDDRILGPQRKVQTPLLKNSFGLNARSRDGENTYYSIFDTLATSSSSAVRRIRQSNHTTDQCSSSFERTFQRAHMTPTPNHASSARSPVNEALRSNINQGEAMGFEKEIFQSDLRSSPPVFLHTSTSYFESQPSNSSEPSGTMSKKRKLNTQRPSFQSRMARSFDSNVFRVPSPPS